MRSIRENQRIALLQGELDKANREKVALEIKVRELEERVQNFYAGTPGTKEAKPRKLKNGD